MQANSERERAAARRRAGAWTSEALPSRSWSHRSGLDCQCGSVPGIESPVSSGAAGRGAKPASQRVASRSAKRARGVSTPRLSWRHARGGRCIAPSAQMRDAPRSARRRARAWVSAPNPASAAAARWRAQGRQGVDQRRAIAAWEAPARSGEGGRGARPAHPRGRRSSCFRLRRERRRAHPRRPASPRRRVPGRSARPSPCRRHPGAGALRRRPGPRRAPRRRRRRRRCSRRRRRPRRARDSRADPTAPRPARGDRRRRAARSRGARRFRGPRRRGGARRSRGAAAGARARRRPPPSRRIRWRRCSRP